MISEQIVRSLVSIMHLSSVSRSKAAQLSTSLLSKPLPAYPLSKLVGTVVPVISRMF